MTKPLILERKPWIPDSEHLYLRTSLIRSYLNDPAACLFRYFKGLVVKPKGYTTLGTCTHLAAEHVNKYKLEKGKDSKLSVMQDIFYESWKERKKNTVFQEDEDPKLIEKEGINRVVPLYYERVHKKIEPLYIEEPFEIHFPDLNATVTGTMDLVERDHLIRDLKTKKRAPRWDEAIKSFQGRSYMAGYKVKFKKDPSGFLLDCIVRKNGAEYIPTKPVKYSDLRTEEYMHTCRRVIMNIRAGIFYPKRDGNHFCSQKWCGFYEICHKGQWMKLPPFTRVYGSNQAAEEESED